MRNTSEDQALQCIHGINWPLSKFKVHSGLLHKHRLLEHILWVSVGESLWGPWDPLCLQWVALSIIAIESWSNPTCLERHHCALATLSKQMVDSGSARSETSLCRAAQAMLLRSMHQTRIEGDGVEPVQLCICNIAQGSSKIIFSRSFTKHNMSYPFGSISFVERQGGKFQNNCSMACGTIYYLTSYALA